MFQERNSKATSKEDEYMQQYPYPPDLDQYFGPQAPVQPPYQQPMPPQYQPPIQPPYQPPVRRAYFGTDRKGIIFALILLCFSILCANSYIYSEHPGLGASIFTVAIFFTLL